MLEFKSPWYKQPSLNTRLSDRELKNRCNWYLSWLTKQYGIKEAEKRLKRQHEAQETLTVPKTLLKPDTIIGYIEELPVTVRYIPQSNEFHYPHPIYAKPGQICKSIGVSAPALYVVGFNGKRIDSFLSATKAKAFAKSFIELKQTRH